MNYLSFGMQADCSQLWRGCRFLAGAGSRVRVCLQRAKGFRGALVVQTKMGNAADPQAFLAKELETLLGSMELKF